METNLTTNRNEGNERARETWNGPLFASGVWRSGTSLLYALLNQHPDIGLFYEGDLPVLRPLFRFHHSRRNWLEKWEYWNAAVSRHGLDSFIPPAPITTLAGAAEVAGREYCRRKRARIWGCKSPSYYDRLVQLAHDFPSARFVIIWRDPEDICHSVIKAASSSRWFASSGMLHRAIMACETLKKQCDQLISLGIPVHQVHYEELVGDTTNAMRRICEFLDIPFIRAVTSLEGADRSAVFQGDHHFLVKGRQIVSSRERKGALPPRVERKVREYKALWKVNTGNDWLLSRYLPDVFEAKPRTWERVKDRFFFSLLRFKDNSPPVAYSVLPLWMWRLYRALKYRDPDYIKHHQRASIDQPQVKKTRRYAAQQGT